MKLQEKYYETIAEQNLEKNIFNILKENFVNEAVQISKEIINAIENVTGKSPVDISDYNKIEIIDNTTSFMVDGVQLKMGGIIKRLSPGISDANLNKVLGKIKSLIIHSGPDSHTKLRFVMQKDVVDGYERCDATSCMSGKGELVKYYNSDPNVHVLLLYHNEEIAGRALVWNNIYDLDSKKYITFIDRTYPAPSETINELFLKYAKKHGWLYRSSQRAESTELISGHTIYHKIKYNDPINFPSMDTLRFAFLIDDVIYLTNNQKLSTKHSKINDSLTKLDGNLFPKTNGVNK